MIQKEIKRREYPCPTKLSSGAPRYHLRDYRHFFSVEDWKAYMDFFDKKLGK